MQKWTIYASYCSRVSDLPVHTTLRCTHAAPCKKNFSICQDELKITNDQNLEDWLKMSAASEGDVEIIVPLESSSL